MDKIENKEQHEQAMYRAYTLIYSNDKEDIKELEKLIKLIEQYEDETNYYKK